MRFATILLMVPGLLGQIPGLLGVFTNTPSVSSPVFKSPPFKNEKGWAPKVSGMSLA